MCIEFVDSYCFAKKGCEKEIKMEWDGATLYKVGGKMFVLIGKDRQGVTMVSTKLEPEFSGFLRAEHSNITPGYHLNKTHWSSFYPCTEPKVDILKTMIHMSYNLVYNSLTKKLKQEIDS